MKEDLKTIFQRLLDDANGDKDDRHYKLTDAQLIYACNQLGEYFLPKEVRTSTDESRANKEPIVIEYIKAKK